MYVTDINNKIAFSLSLCRLSECNKDARDYCSSNSSCFSR